jgi:hypothetical protein
MLHIVWHGGRGSPFARADKLAPSNPDTAKFGLERTFKSRVCFASIRLIE